MVYAGFWRRAGAVFIDILVGSPIFALQMWLIGISIPAAILSLLIPGMVFSLYPVVFHARWGQTIGKMATGIKVVRVDGQPIDMRVALLRSSVDMALWVFYALMTTGALFAWSGPEWSSMGRLERLDALRGESLAFGLYSWISKGWAWSEVVVMLFNRKRRAIHDFIAGTVVIRVPQPSAGRVQAGIDPGVDYQMEGYGDPPQPL
ncbi:MAG: RDD family protein [Actinomycetota bacterium]